MQLFSVDKDLVVDALVSLGKVSYGAALETLYPLVNRLDFQRSVQNQKFYQRLQRDIIKGCLMPPITLAFVLPEQKEVLYDLESFLSYVQENMSDGFILDGIQRLHALKRAQEQDPASFPRDQSLFLNVILCPSVDNLLYRMITLNNGQRPMSARHQVEILASNAFTFEDSGLTFGTEKDAAKAKKSERKSPPGLFKKADFELAYMAFLSGSVAVDSQKLIQEKLDELLATKILETAPVKGSLQFYEVIELISELIRVPLVDAWFKNSNNLIGFCVGIRRSYPTVKAMEIDEFGRFTEAFDAALARFQVSKIKLGRARRIAASFIVERIDTVRYLDSDDIAERLTSVID